jgi:hypothetical protein
MMRAIKLKFQRQSYRGRPHAPKHDDALGHEAVLAADGHKGLARFAPLVQQVRLALATGSCIAGQPMT